MKIIKTILTMMTLIILSSNTWALDAEYSDTFAPYSNNMNTYIIIHSDPTEDVYYIQCKIKDETEYGDLYTDESSYFNTVNNYTANVMPKSLLANLGSDYEDGEYPYCIRIYNRIEILIGEVEVPFIYDATLPIADAGPDQIVMRGDVVYLSGLSSTDNYSGVDFYSWVEKSVDSISIDLIATPTFIAPETLQTFEIELLVRDAAGNMPMLGGGDICLIQVVEGNEPPEAIVGENQIVNEGDFVTLDATNSTDDNGIVSYEWIQLSGTTVELIDSDSSQPAFTAPEVGVEGESFIFQVTVRDEDVYFPFSDSDTCIVTVLGDNDPPVAIAGDSQRVTEGDTVNLSGSASYDPDGSIHSCLWVQSSGPLIVLSNASSVTPTFVAPSGSIDYEVELTLQVLDDGGLYNTDTITIYVEDNGIIDFDEDVTSTETTTDRSIGFEVESGGAVIYFNCILSSSIVDTNGMPLDFPYGLIDLELKADDIGGNVVVTIFLDRPVSEDYKWFKYNDGWIDYSDYAVFNIDRDEVTLTFIDGGIGDDDGIANGIIVDPSGLGSNDIVDDNDHTSTDSDSEGCFISSIL